MESATTSNRGSKNLEDFQNPTVFTLAGVESWTDALIVTDKTGNVCYINAAAERLTGYSIVQMQDQPLASFIKVVNEADRNQVTDPIVQCIILNRRVSFRNHDILTTQQGKDFAIGGHTAPIRRSEGTIVGAVLKFRDVTPTRLLLQRISY